MTVRFSIRAPNSRCLGREASPDAIIAAAKKAEEVGFDTIFVIDHIVGRHRMEAALDSFEINFHGDRDLGRLLKLDVDESNIDRLEKTPCEEIFAERERQYQESYRETPVLDELRDRYGDPTNRRIYSMSRDVEGRWLDLHRHMTGASQPID